MGKARPRARFACARLNRVSGSLTELLLDLRHAAHLLPGHLVILASLTELLPGSPSCGTPGLSGREFRAQIVNHKRNSIWRFSGAAATGFLGRLGGQASGPISCCCNDMLSQDCRLEGAPSVPKSGEKMAVFQQNSSICTLRLTWRFLGWSSRDIVCCESSAFILRPSSFIGAAVACSQALEPAVCGMFRYPDPSRSGGRGSPVPAARSRCAMMAAFERGLWPGVAGCLGTRTTYDQFSICKKRNGFGVGDVRR